jgi:hypothetical protein
MIRGRHLLAPIALALLGACVDTTPIHVEETHKDAAAGTPAECRECVEGEGKPCRFAYDLCLTVPDCPQFHQCVLERGCYTQPLLEDRLACGQPCLDMINLTSTHPGLPGILALNDCTQEECRAECVTPE